MNLSPQPSRLTVATEKKSPNLKINLLRAKLECHCQAEHDLTSSDMYHAWRSQVTERVFGNDKGKPARNVTRKECKRLWSNVVFTNDTCQERHEIHYWVLPTTVPSERALCDYFHCKKVRAGSSFDWSATTLASYEATTTWARLHIWPFPRKLMAKKNLFSCWMLGKT